jgi:hypothetical protein
MALSKKTCRQRGADEGHMDELVERLVANVGIDSATAQQAIKIILKFLVQEGPADKVQTLIGRIPGAQAAVASAEDISGGVMGAGMQMMGAGLNMGQVQAVTKEVIGYAREKVGEDEVGEIVDAIPGLSQFV